MPLLCDLTHNVAKAFGVTFHASISTPPSPSTPPCHLASDTDDTKYAALDAKMDIMIAHMIFKVDINEIIKFWSQYFHCFQFVTFGLYYISYISQGVFFTDGITT